MKRLLRFRSITVAVTLLFGVLFGRLLIAADKQDARVTQIVHDVRVLPSQATGRPASLNETIRQGTGVRTGSESRAELTFNDQSLTRLGANTVFNFDQGARNLNLNSGAVLLCVPPDAGNVRIIAPAITAAISGGIAMAEAHKNSWTKVIVIEGQARVTLKRSGETATLNPGQIIAIPPGAKHLTPVHNIDLKKLTRNSLLIQFAKLPGWTRDLMNAEIRKQKVSPPSGGFIDPTGFDAIDQRAAARPATPPPLPSRPPGDRPPGR